MALVHVKTGGTVAVPGIYVANHCGRPERTFPKGHRVPPCVGCRVAIVWTLVRATHTGPTK